MAEDEEATCSKCGYPLSECGCGFDFSCDDEELGKEDPDDVPGKLQNES